MKKVIMLMGMVCMATSAMAFGGGGSGHDSTKYNRHNPGVDNFGVHIHPDNPPLDIRFYDIKNDANAQLCQEGANVYCCKEGYVVDVATSKCVACPDGSVASLDENFKCTVCAEEMIPNQDNTACVLPLEKINEEKQCKESGYKWCSGNNTCIDKQESCLCEGKGGACQKCDDNGAWVTDETLNGQACGAGVCTNGQCCQGETCAGADEELYCGYTNAQGECESWFTCAEGKSSGASIVGVKSEAGGSGACAGADEELYCQYTNTEGECEHWDICAEGKSSKDSIVGVKAEYGCYGACADEEEEVYCAYVSAQGECYEWLVCNAGKSTKDWIVGLKNENGTIGACAYGDEELYCSYTNAQGECEIWSTCAGKSSKDWIVGVKNESSGSGSCAGEGQELYCWLTNAEGECENWDTCAEGKSTKEWIVGMPNALGQCAYNDGDDLYCAQAGPSGCNEYRVCTVDGEVGKDLEAYAKQTGHDVGGEVCCPEGKVYCQVAFLDGTCEHHACQANYEGELTQGIYGDLDVICPSAANLYIIKEEDINGNGRFVGGCCYGTVEPGDAYQGIGDTCTE